MIINKIKLLCDTISTKKNQKTIKNLNKKINKNWFCVFIWKNIKGVTMKFCKGYTKNRI